MSVQTEQLEVVGLLTLDVEQFEMLHLEPIMHTTPRSIREFGVITFYVIGLDGFAKNIFVKGDFVIEPLILRHTKEVKFLIEEVTDTDTSAEPLAAQ